METGRTYRLLDADGRPILSSTPGTLGGHRGTGVYGRLDCPAASRALGRGGYVPSRVFFADEATAVRAGYRPCAACLPEAYRAWKQDRAALDCPPRRARRGRTGGISAADPPS